MPDCTTHMGIRVSWEGAALPCPLCATYDAEEAMTAKATARRAALVRADSMMRLIYSRAPDSIWQSPGLPDKEDFKEAMNEVARALK